MIRSDSWGIRCHQTECYEALELKHTSSTDHARALTEDYEALLPALDTAAVFLGWRIYQHVYWCPLHVVAKNLACENCRALCPNCTCAGGPRGTAVFGGIPTLSLEGNGK
jgi:hypothetical protein